MSGSLWDLPCTLLDLMSLMNNKGFDFKLFLVIHVVHDYFFIIERYNSLLKNVYSHQLDVRAFCNI